MGVFDRAREALAARLAPSPPRPLPDAMPAQPGDLFLPQAGVPSSFLPYLNDRTKGRVVSPVVNARLPIIEQERFERRLYYLAAQVTGTGAAIASFYFDPPEDFPSFRINRLFFRGETTNGLTTYLRLYKQSATSGQVQAWEFAKGICPSGQGTLPLVMDDASVMWSSAGTGVTRCCGPVEVYRNYRDTEATSGAREYFQVYTGENVTNTQTVQLYGELESIPDVAQARNVTNMMSNTP